MDAVLIDTDLTDKLLTDKRARAAAIAGISPPRCASPNAHFLFLLAGASSD
jgi:hypothetical protein